MKLSMGGYLKLGSVGGVFINTLPEKVESEDSELYSYHQHLQWKLTKNY